MHQPAVGQRERERVARLLQPRHLARGEHPHAELEGLQRGLAGEGVAAHAEREPEVVLDPRRRRRLSARRDRVEQHRAQPLGRPVDRRGESGGAPAHDREIGGRVVVVHVRESEHLGDLARRRVAHVLALHDRDGQVAAREAVLEDVGRGLGVVGIDPGVRELEALGVPAQGRGPGRTLRADDLQGQGGRTPPQEVAARPQRAQQDVAQLVVLRHQPLERRVVDAVHAAGLRRARREERPLASEQPQLADERAWAEGDDGCLADPGKGVAHHLDRAALDEDEVVPAVSRAEQHVPHGDVDRRASRDEPIPLGIGELRDDGGMRLAHVPIVPHASRTGEALPQTGECRQARASRSMSAIASNGARTFTSLSKYA